MSTLSSHPALLQVGARSPLGLNALQIAMCARAGKAEPRRTPYKDQRNYNVGMIWARFLDAGLSGFERLAALAAPALAEAGQGLRAPLPLVLGLPEEARPDDEPRYGAPLIEELGRQSGVPVDLAASETLRAGHASFALVLEVAIAKLQLGLPAVLFVAVDSYLHPEVVRWLDAGARLHAPGTEDGIIPSEGAAFAVLARWTDGDGPKLLAPLYGNEVPTPIATIRHVGTGRDESVLDPALPLLATVMTELVQQGSISLGGKVPWLLSDLNGEYHRLREWSRVEIRSDSALEDTVHDRLADQMGDIGAASGAMALALAATRWQTQCAPAPSMLCALHAEMLERGVFVAVEEAATEDADDGPAQEVRS